MDENKLSEQEQKETEIEESQVAQGSSRALHINCKMGLHQWGGTNKCQRCGKKR